MEEPEAGEMDDTSDRMIIGKHITIVTLTDII